MDISESQPQADMDVPPPPRRSCTDSAPNNDDVTSYYHATSFIQEISDNKYGMLQSHPPETPFMDCGETRTHLPRFTLSYVVNQFKIVNGGSTLLNNNPIY